MSILRLRRVQPRHLAVLARLAARRIRRGLVTLDVHDGILPGEGQRRHPRVRVLRRKVLDELRVRAHLAAVGRRAVREEAREEVLRERKAAEDALLAAQLSPYWKAASLAKAGYDVATGEAPAWWDVGLATVGYGAKTKQGKKAVNKLKDLWRKAPKKEMAAVTIPFFASEAKKGAYPIRPKPVEPKKIDYGSGTRDQLDRIRRQTMLR